MVITNDQICRQLLHEFEASAGQPLERRWSWLAAAHIVGQQRLSLHFKTHVVMLQFAVQTADYPEAAGQLLRLALVPFGHALGRLPLGNSGRAGISAFKPMPLDQTTAQAIAHARSEAKRLLADSAA